MTVAVERAAERAGLRADWLKVDGVQIDVDAELDCPAAVGCAAVDVFGEQNQFRRAVDGYCVAVCRRETCRD